MMALADAIERLRYLGQVLREGTPEQKRRAEKELRFAERYGHSPRPSMTREKLLPYIGQPVIVHLTPRMTEQLMSWSTEAAIKFTTRNSTLSDVGEIRAYFDLGQRPKGGWDIPIVAIERLDRA